VKEDRAEVSQLIRNGFNFTSSGAIAIGIGTELIPTEAIQRRQSTHILELAHRFSGFVKEAREQLET
jgi:2-keto-3-deoxy-6-phosphogluconate aldolase